MTTYWCANFDGGPVLDPGFEINAWLMQYQYEHGGFEFQGNRRQKGKTTATWKSLCDISIGDWILAYLSGSTFFAIGQVCLPRKVSRGDGHTDTVSRTVSEARHIHLDGIVRYTDAEAFYEDFTDTWNLSIDPRRPNQPQHWLYPQRIDVTRWENVVPDGITMSGLARAAPFPECRKPIFQVDASFFRNVADQLRVESKNTHWATRRPVRENGEIRRNTNDP